jgi:hypothetical protein
MPIARSRRLPLLLVLCVAATSFLLATGSHAAPAASVGDPAEEAPDMLLDPCFERDDALGGPDVGGALTSAFEAHDDRRETSVRATRARAAYRSFRGRALRLRRAGPGNPYQNLWTRHDEGFEVWTPNARKMDRDEALRFVGARDLADRHQFAVALTEWTWALTLGATAALMVGGFAAGAAAGYMFPAPVLGAVGTASLGGTFGLLAGLLGLTVMPATWGIARMLRADDDETLEHVQAYNREQARDAGLDEAEIPFTFLGY